MKLLLKTAALVAASALCAPALFAQWEKRTNPNTPRLANGQVNLDAPTPKAADGHPDLSGLWSRAPGDGRGFRHGSRIVHELLHPVGEGGGIFLRKAWEAVVFLETANVRNQHRFASGECG